MTVNNCNILDVEILEKAYEKLSLDDQIAIDRIADKMVEKFKDRWQSNTKPMFGRLSALELIANLGILINDAKGEQK